MVSTMPGAPRSSPLRFDRFVFTHRGIDALGIRLGFRLERAADGSRVDLEETVALPPSLRRLWTTNDPALARALRGVHLAAGTSYWKTCLPETIEVEDESLSDDDVVFWNELYTKGLAEFFYRNGIDPEGRVRFRNGWKPVRTRAPRSGPFHRSLLLWGGGKDSVVAHEALAASGERHALLTIGREDWRWIGASAKVAGAPHHLLARRLDPALGEMNAGGALNGHVPVSAFLAFASHFVALLCGYSAVLAANESSASEGNTRWHGVDVNHQWSKSLEFERLFQAWQRRNVEDGPTYGSLLRPLSELAIVRAFTGHPTYFASVTSCNRNFTQSGPAARRWCLACPKCVFTATMARPWLDDSAYRSLFGGDPLADPANAPLVEELLGLAGVKPFECVGTPEETALALALARRRGRDLPGGRVAALADRAAARFPDVDAAARRLLARGDEHALTPRWIEVLDAYLDRP